MKKFEIRMLTNRKDGHKTVAYCETLEEVYERINALKVYYNPIDIYFRFAN